MLFLKVKSEYGGIFYINMAHVVEFDYDPYHKTTTIFLSNGKQTAVKGNIAELKKDNFFYLKEVQNEQVL